MRSSYVKILTCAATLLACGCSLIDHHLGESCNSHAYLFTPLADHLSQRFHSGAPVRLAVVPFSVPANLTSYNNERIGVENKLAWGIHQALLNSGEIPIVEVLNRQDWPGKKEEFFSGNFNAIALSREAGYDLVLVGYVEPSASLDSLSAYSKIIEIESGTTIWYAKSSVATRRKDFEEVWATAGLVKRRPDLMYQSVLVDQLAQCIVSGALSQENPG